MDDGAEPQVAVEPQQEEAPQEEQAAPVDAEVRDCRFPLVLVCRLSRLTLVVITPQAPEPPRPSRPQRQILNKYQDGQEEPAEADPAAVPASFGDQGGDPDARVHLDKMKIQSLRKYAKMYDLSTVHPQSSKEELVSAIKRHWAGAHVSEDALVQNLMRLRSRGASF